MSDFGHSLDSYIDEKRKWDNMLEQQNYFDSLRKSAEQGEIDYNSSLARQEDLRKRIEEGERSNAEYDMRMADLKERSGRVNRSMERRMPYGVPSGADAIYEDDGRLSGYNYGGKFFSREGIENGNYADQGFSGDGNGTSGAWGAASFNPYERRIAEMDGKRVDVDSMRRELVDEEGNGRRLQKLAARKAMFDDPRYTVAQMKSKADMDPSAMYNYMNQWEGEQRQAESDARMQKTYDAMDSMKASIVGQYGDDIGEEYGPNARMAYRAMLDAEDPQTFNAYMNMFNNIVVARDSSDRIQAQQRIDNQNADINTIQDYENLGLANGKMNDPNFQAMLSNMKARFENKWGMPYDSSSNVGYQAGMKQKELNYRRSVEKYLDGRKKAESKFAGINDPSLREQFIKKYLEENNIPKPAGMR